MKQELSRPSSPSRKLSRARKLFKDLHYSWPWALIGLVIGVTIGLLSRLPLLPPPNSFTQQFWTTFVGAVGGAAVTVIGTLHFARVSRRKETLDAAKALATLMMAPVVNGQKIVSDMLPFPQNESGEFNRSHVEMRSPQQWDRYHTGAASLLRYVDQALADVQLYKPSLIGLELDGRSAIRDLERVLGLLKDMTEDFVRDANGHRVGNANAALHGSSIEAFRLFPRRIVDAAAQLRSANVM